MCHRILSLLIFCFSFCSLLQAQQANTLLWRISGHGLAKPSYLFGTMHVTDKRAFNFEDSLYHFIETTEAFAMEFHPDSASAIFTAQINSHRGGESDLEKNLTAKERAELAQVLRTHFKAAKGQEKQTLQGLMNRLMNSDGEDKDAMYTFMDAYLYDIARRRGKEIYGLEQPQDQVRALQSLSGGINAQKFIALLKSWKPNAASPVQELYYKEDLARIDQFFTDYFTPPVLDIFLYKRNGVMAAKMDSLMQVKSLFTAVGAGHLAGDKGVLALLKAKGYTVEPVFSQTRIPPSAYHMKGAAYNWQVVTNAAHRFQYQLPAQPTLQEGVQGSQVAIHYDLGGGLVFIVISGPTATFASGSSGAAQAREHLSELALRAGATLISSDSSRVDSLQVFDALCKAKDNTFFRYREWISGHMFYLFTLTAQKKEALYNEAAANYFSSFKPLARTASVWQQNSFEQDGFSVQLPVVPKIETKKMSETGGKLQWTLYTGFDAATGNNYTISSNKALDGNSLMEGEHFFETYINSIEKNTGGQPLQITDTVLNGFAAKTISTRPGAGHKIKALVVKRDNVGYFFIAEYGGERGAQDAQRFIHSIALISFRKGLWKNETAPDGSFSAWVPGPIKGLEKDSVYGDAATTGFYTYDSCSAGNFFIVKKDLSKYFWAPNIDSAYNHYQKQNVNEWSDSVVEASFVSNGRQRAKEVVLCNKVSKTKTRLRYVLDGSAMYTLSAQVPPSFSDEENTDRFFNSFVLAHAGNNDGLFSHRPELVFMDLQYEDSAYFTNAYNALSDIAFTQAEVPLLLQKALLHYPQTKNQYTTVNERLLNIASNLLQQTPNGSDTLRQFVQTHYPQLDTSLAFLRYPLLRLLTADGQPESYHVLKSLLLSGIPRAGNAYPLFYALEGKPHLSKSLYPELLQYLNDTTIGSSVVSLTSLLLDSNFIQTPVVATQKNVLLPLLNAHLKKALRSAEPDYEVLELIRLVGRLNFTEGNVLIGRFLAAKEIPVQYEAAVALLKNGAPVNSSLLNRLAGDRAYRISLYKAFQKMNRLQLFPTAYRSQKSMAEGYIMDAVYDEDMESVPEFIYIKKIEEEYAGQKKRFYLYRLNFKDEETETGNEDENASSYLAIAGPFDLNEARIDLSDKDNISGTYYKSNFDGYQLDELFRKYIRQVSK